MNFLFVTDPLPSFKISKDSTYAMMSAAQARGHTIAVCQPEHLSWQSGSRVQVKASAIHLTGHPTDWYQVDSTDCRFVCDFCAVLMRKDPPCDAAYADATHLLQQAEREGARVFNRPGALRDHPEKLAILEFAQLFPQFLGPTLVTRCADDIRQFHHVHQDIILKPLDGMGGRGIFRVPSDGLNLGSIVETLTDYGAQTVMVQKFLPAIAHGDKRILLIEGQAVPYCLARIPQAGEVRGNLAAGGRGVAQPLSPSDLLIANALGPILARRGLFLVGLDVIGEHLTEINVTSPTCFLEISDQTGLDVAALFVQALEAKLVASSPVSLQ